MSISKDSFHVKQNPVFTGLKFGFGSASVNITTIIPDTYWIATLGGTGFDAGRGIALDSSRNVYICGQTASSGEGSNDISIAKFDSSSNIEFQFTLGNTLSQIANDIAVDNSGNIYIVGEVITTGSTFKCFIAKYNSLGAVQWQKTLNTNRGTGDGIAVDNSGNIYIVGSAKINASDTYNNAIIAKYDSSGTLLYQKSLGSSSTYAAANGIAVSDDGDYLFITGNIDTSNSKVLVHIANSSDLTKVHDRKLTSTNYDLRGNAVVADTDNTDTNYGNIFYVTGYTDDGDGNNSVLISKYRLYQGTILKREILSGSGDDRGHGIAVDSSGNFYIVGETTSDGAGNRDILIAKYNSSLEIVWQRTLGGTGADYGYDIAVDARDNVYIVGQTASAGEGSSDILIAKLPGDGSLTGTYGSFTYASCSLTESNKYYTSDTSNISFDSTPGLSSDNYTFTSNSAGLTTSITAIE